jgi:methylmalonyl-CoA mutase cobalamin-binding domain/chain
MKMGTKRDHNDIANRLKKTIMEADFNGAPQVAQEALDAGIDPNILMKHAIGGAIKELEEKFFEDYKAWLHPVYFMAVEGARRALEVLEPYFKKGDDSKGVVVLGTPASDTQDIGGKIVAIALTAAGFDVHYLGRDVAPIKFVEKVIETGAQILGISCYVTTGFQRIRKVLELLSNEKISDKINVMVGGTVITEKFADKYNLGYAKTSSGAVELAYSYVGGK